MRITFLSVLLLAPLVVLLLLLLLPAPCASFAPPRKAGGSVSSQLPPPLPGGATNNLRLGSTKNGNGDDDVPLPTTSDVVTTVAVAGATGRTGSLVVKELRRRGVNVVALVRSVEKAEEVLLGLQPDETTTAAAAGAGGRGADLTIVQCDLGDPMDIKSAVEGTDASVWCATGFSDGPSSMLDRIKNVLGVALRPKQSIDAVGVVALAEAYAEAAEVGKVNGGEGGGGGGVNGDDSTIEPLLPKVIMLSSAGVTRPSWDDDKKQQLVGAAEIPIVRLNPFGILDIKAEAEDKLRGSGTPYCIFRPGGLNDSWPAGSRPVFSQGDVAVGRINRVDVAKILVDCLSTPEATGKTFEGISAAGYPPSKSIGPALARLSLDAEGGPSSEAVLATYGVLQQLLPGEKQRPDQLAMGQTYEQLDRGETGRLGERGKENVAAAADDVGVTR